MLFSIPQALEEYKEFWLKFFPESASMTKQEAHGRVNDAISGSGSKLPDPQLVGYQDQVAEIYGAYEQLGPQLEGMKRLLEEIFVRDVEVKYPNLVSLGCGPGSYELWLLSKGFIEQVTLVDQSPAMLERACTIAEALGLAARVVIVNLEAQNTRLPSKCADVVLCINAMHWSRKWQEWIREAARLTKPGAPAFISFTADHARSKIQPQNFAREMRQYFQMQSAGFMQDVEALRQTATHNPTAFVAVSMRMFGCGKRLRHF
ncbi:MAG: hypothetical protein A3F54_05555 [Candidatus Kerfeldbacteria bacterium RIFCSPHIGHO2_12_FULL_48_17]|uniref:Methyltransferase type 11 domain-containing protein n=1 Tax=Candidatus Kerfeldbacteria bacterium RIFCSPHIGHO2_12_FULL_48_17 TaxID=1798542 RepID=A0A1G2B5T4_9BACT|nr:MAG: hypothetical protein A3F54_05555 [Candidatus Kerfeldbacteria bacterium RIFCSPHIGHO2_12_FULL_48_17]